VELKANIASFCTFYGGLFFISDAIPLWVSTLLFIAILTVNMVFWFTWAKNMFHKHYLKLRNLIMAKFCNSRLQKLLAKEA